MRYSQFPQLERDIIEKAELLVKAKIASKGAPKWSEEKEDWLFPGTYGGGWTKKEKLLGACVLDYWSEIRGKKWSKE